MANSNLMDFIGSGGGLQLSMSGVYDTARFIEASQADLQVIKDLYAPITVLDASVSGAGNSATSMVFDPVNNFIYIYGGYNGATQSDTLIKYDITTGTKTVISTALTGTARHLHTMVFDSTNNLLYIYGGHNGTAPLDDLVKYDLTAGTATVISATATGTVRYTSGMVFDDTNNLLYIYGGNNGTAYINDLVKYDITVAVATTVNTALLTTARGHHSMAFDSTNNLLYIYGGYDTAEINELVKYDITGAVVSVINTATLATARRGCGMAFDSSKNSLLIYGGISGSAFYDTLYLYDLTNNTTKLLDPTFTGINRSNCGFSLDSTNNLIYVYGGDGVTISDDLTKNDLTKILEIADAKLIIPRIK